MDDDFAEFVRSRLPGMSRIAYLLTGDHHAAEDLVQNALVRVATRWSRVREADDPVRYVRKIIYNEHISMWRRRRLQMADGSEPALAALPAGRDVASDVVVRVVLRSALAKLTRRQRAVIVLRFFEDLTEEATAEVLGCSVGTVKSQTHHALGRLRLLAPELAGSLGVDAEARR